MGAYLAVMIGGAIGSLLRFGAGQAFAGGLHWTTLGINWIGCLILGFFLTYAGQNGRVPERLRLGFGTGVMGGFTTFSTFSVDALQLFQKGQSGEALAYLLASLAGGVFLAWIGTLTARKVAGV